MDTDYQVKRLEQLLNDRPVRKFNYLTPNQMLQQKIALITRTFKILKFVPFISLAILCLIKVSSINLLLDNYLTIANA